ncbi:hypothetical protein [Halomonas caseinilytica]|uniref:hypothetical protein n=1 Tax=Halomonas caseinilytica TaxID=438744 RepID=UPI000AAA671B|nr:hypothetical protein [Halomonas caseinilytica]
MRWLSPLLGTLIVMGLAGCSYHPARISPEPAIVIDDDRYYHDRDWHDRDWKRDRDYRHRDHDRWKRHRDYRYHEHDRGRGGFCPPGLAKQGRC